MPANSSIEELLKKLEERLLQSNVRSSAAEVAALLADEFVEFGASGRVFDKAQVVQNLRTEIPARRSLVDFKTITLAPGVVLATYRAIRREIPGETTSSTLRSSVWKLKDGR